MKITFRTILFAAIGAGIGHIIDTQIKNYKERK